jgi:hypothetical protein
MLVLMPIMKQRTIPRSRNKGHNQQYVTPQQGGVLMPLSVKTPPTCPASMPPFRTGVLFDPITTGTFCSPVVPP